MITKQSALNIIGSIKDIWDSVGSHYPQELIDKYRGILLSSSGIDILPKEGYKHDFSFVNEWFTLYWNVPRILDELDRWKIENKPVSECLLRISTDDLNLNKVKAFTHTLPSDPIIIAEIPFSDMEYCIVDGNHRVAAASQAGIDNIDSIWLSYACHPRFMPEKSQLLFAACCDLQTLTNYFMGNISSDECLSYCLFK